MRGHDPAILAAVRDDGRLDVEGRAQLLERFVPDLRQAALGDALIPYEDRVRDAMRAILARRAWTDPQKRWLKRIGEQIEKEIVVDRTAIDKEPFIADGGFNRLNKVFGGELESILAGINEELWKKAA